jgi:hypothetical protein
MDDEVLSSKRLAMSWLQCHHGAGSLVSHSQTRLSRLSLPNLSTGLQPLYGNYLCRQQSRPAPLGLVVARHLQRRALHRAFTGTVTVTPVYPSLAQAHLGECLCQAESNGADRQRHGNRRDVSERRGKKAKSTAIRLIHRVVEPISGEVTAAMRMIVHRWSARLDDKVGNVACEFASIPTPRH